MPTNFYIPQTAALKSVIHSIWQVDRLGINQRETIIPKGIVEIIFNLTEGCMQASFGKIRFSLSRCFINAFNTVPIAIDLPMHQIFLGVQLQPLVASKLFRIDSAEFANAPVDLISVDKYFDSLWHQLMEQSSFQQRVATINTWIGQKLFEWEPREKRMNDFLFAVDQHELNVSGLANILCYSKRHLSRKLLSTTGMNTEEMLRYKRYLHAVHLMHNTSLSLSAIAHQSHFADHAHFTKSFKSFTGIAPGEYMCRKTELKGHLFENVR